MFCSHATWISYLHCPSNKLSFSVFVIRGAISFLFYVCLRWLDTDAKIGAFSSYREKQNATFHLHTIHSNIYSLFIFGFYAPHLAVFLSVVIQLHRFEQSIVEMFHACNFLDEKNKNVIYSLRSQNTKQKFLF